MASKSGTCTNRNDSKRPFDTWRQRILLLIGLAWLLGPTTPALWGQNENYLEAIGVPTFTTVSPVESGFVNASTGDLHLEIPLGSWPQRGSRQSTAVLIYDSNIWGAEPDYSPDAMWTYNITDEDGWGGFHNGVNERVMGGWRLITSEAEGRIDFSAVSRYTQCGEDTDFLGYEDYIDWFWIEPDGTEHTFAVHTRENYACVGGQYGGAYCGICASDSLALDGSGYHLFVTNAADARVYAPDGTLVASNLGAGVTDTNGNYSGYNGGGYFYNTNSPPQSDTLGRTLVTETFDGSYVYYDVLNSQGGTSRYTVTTQSIDTYPCFSNVSITHTFTVIQSIQLPDGSAYSFTYDSGTSCTYGLLSSMQLPTGGTITYSFESVSDYPYIAAYYNSPQRMLATRTTTDGTWQYHTSFDNSTCTSNNHGLWLDCRQIFSVTKPSQGREVYTLQANGSALPIQAQYYDRSGNLLASIDQAFDLMGYCSTDWLCPIPLGASLSATKHSTTTTLPVPGGSASATRTYMWDTSGPFGGGNGNVTQVSEWNFGSDTSGNPDRTTTYTYWSDSNSAYVTANILNRVASETVTDSNGTVVRQTMNSYDTSSLETNGATGIVNHDDSGFGSGNMVRGNLTQVQQLVSGAYLTKSMTYDITGQVRTATDWSNSNTTTYDYTDNFFTDTGNGSDPSVSPYNPSQPTNAYLHTVAAGGLTTTYGYYWGTGQKAIVKDPNLQPTYFHFYDPLNRPTLTKLPNTGWTYAEYPDATHMNTGKGINSTSFTTSCNATSGDCRSDGALLDSLGRASSQTLISDPDGQTTVGTSYDSNGRVYSVSNPHRTGGSPTDGTESYLYDGLSRKSQTTRADGSVAHTYYGSDVASNGGSSSQLCSGYGIGYPMLVVDEASRRLQHWYDGFGRLIEVDEPDPSNGSLTSGTPFGTCYAYDLNNNLTGVGQGSQTRTFTYDKFSRLLTAWNPESGWTTYVYDQNPNCPSPNSFPGQLVSKTDARGVRTCMQYDSLSRLTQKNYSTGESPVNYGYDQTSYNGFTIANGKGRRTAMSDETGATAWNYDSVGNIKDENRTTAGVTKTMHYEYKFDGSVASVTYPTRDAGGTITGNTVTYTIKGAQRPTVAQDLGSNITYASTALYAPHGGLSSLMNGNNGILLSTLYYNQRLQPCRIAVNSSGSAPGLCGDTNPSNVGNLIDLQYNFNAGSGDNGNVLGIANKIDGTRSQSFSYDWLNRIASAAGSTYSQSPTRCWGETFSIDRYGNLTAIGAISSAYNGCAQEYFSLSATAGNQLSTGTSPNFAYDAAGDMTNNLSVSLTYDAENRVRTVNGVTYYYDGDGKRVQKSNGTLYWYGTSADPLAEGDASGNITDEYIFFGGKRIARRRY